MAEDIRKVGLKIRDMGVNVSMEQEGKGK